MSDISVDGKSYSIITDHLGTPTEMYQDDGTLFWEREINANGKVIKETQQGSCPFLFQGQYYDAEIELAYNRFRYYDPEDGRYISQDPIGLASGEPNFYAYVADPNTWIDPLGLSRRGNQATRDHIEVVKNKFVEDNPTAKHIGGGLKNGEQLKEVYIPPKNKIPGSTKGGSYADLTFKTADGKIVHINTVDKGSFDGMTNRELTNLNRIKSDVPHAKVIAVGKGDNPGDLSMNKKSKTSYH